ncbi:MAG: MOSC domain-containing protein [Lysobacter sp.]|nr:MOSC domain-containing protein [Lysobacter sp.]
MHLSSLHLYPLKSAAGLAVETIDILPRGPRHDRRWLVVDADNRFVTARQVSQMVLIRAQVQENGLRLSAPGMPDLDVASPLPDASRLRVTIWKDTVDAPVVDPAADAWLSGFLQQPVRLVHMDDDARRAVDPAYARPGDEVSFADGYPLLVIAQTALDGLNARLAEAGRAPVAMAQFRPNLVVAGAAAHAEDHWKRVRIGGLEFEAVKPCARCVFTTVDPVSGARRHDGEPLNILKDYRRTPGGITFGMNLIPRGSGVLLVGDAMAVLA